MVSAVRSRPNHYETLGLSPDVSDDEIRDAFARMMGMFGAHSVVAAASVSAAFGVLRNPAKRREYDRTLDLPSEPASGGHWRVGGVGWSTPGTAAAGWSPAANPHAAPREAAAQRDRARAEQSPPAEKAADLPEATAPRDPARAEQSPPAEPRMASFIGSALRDLARAIEPQGASDSRLKAEARPQQRIEPGAAVSQDRLAERRPDPDLVLDAEYSSLELRRPGLIALGAVAAAGLLGAIAGVSAGKEEQPPPAKQGVTVRLPAAPDPGSAFDPPVAAAGIRETQTRLSRRARAKAAPARAAARPQIVAPAMPPVERSQAANSGPAADTLDAANGGQPEPGPDAAKAVPAAMPLPNRVVARTIARIGYSCGTVVSTTSVEGAGPGVYKVACSSGETFQATPVRGRYRFRRAGQ